MAKDILDAIRQAEEDAKNRESEAKLAAQKKIENTMAQAQQMINDAELNFEKEAQKRYESARIDGDNEMLKAKNAADGKCGQIQKIADSNREAVVEKAVEFILQ